MFRSSTSRFRVPSSSQNTPFIAGPPQSRRPCLLTMPNAREAPTRDNGLAAIAGRLAAVSPKQVHERAHPVGDVSG